MMYKALLIGVRAKRGVDLGLGEGYRLDTLTQCPEMPLLNGLSLLVLHRLVSPFINAFLIRHLG